MSEHTPENARAGHAVSDMLAALDATRNYLWGVLCAEELTTASNHPAANLYRVVEEAIEKARFG